jgi:hypothetical protein
MFGIRIVAVHTAACIGLALLCGCGERRPDAKQMQAEANKMTKPLPGLYRSTTKLTSFELPGADPEVADTMRDRFAQVLPQVRDVCVTPEAAQRGFADFIRQSQQGDCKTEEFSADTSALRARMTCRLGPKLASTVTMDGTGEPTHSHIDLEIVQTGPSVAGGSETIAMTIDNVRVGDCPK